MKPFNPLSPGRINMTFFAWTAEDGVNHVWSINQAMAIIERDKIEPNFKITLAIAQKCLELNPIAQKLRAEAVDSVDLERPLILIEHDSKHLIIDGWHRLSKMVKTGRTEPLKCYYIPEATAKLFKIQ